MDAASFQGDSAAVARDLLGCTLVHGDLRGRIVETEAYYGDSDVKDPASHAFTGKTDRNAPMFGPPGRAYVYICYGIHHMLNVVTGPDGEPGAVLIRAAAPVAGLDTMRSRRDVDADTALCSGPGKLCEAFAVTTDHDGTDLTAGDLRIEDGPVPDDVVRDTRIGISVGEELPLRFYDADSPHVSRR